MNLAQARHCSSVAAGEPGRWLPLGPAGDPEQQSGERGPVRRLACIRAVRRWVRVVAAHHVPSPRPTQAA